MALVNPMPAFSFTVQMGSGMGGPDAAFAEVSGLDMEREVEEVREGGENRFLHRLPGKVSHGNLVLKRGIMPFKSPLHNWCANVIEGDLGTTIETADLNVALLGPKKVPLMVWSVVRAWPVKVQIAAFDAQKNDVAMETIELAYQRVTRSGANARI